MLLSHTFIAVVVVAVLSGCGGKAKRINLQPEDIPEIRFGMTPDDLADALKCKTPRSYRASHGGDSTDRFRASLERPFTHEFTLLLGVETVLCVRSQVIVSRASVHFVFIDDRLARINLAGQYAPSYGFDQYIPSYGFVEDVERLLEMESATPVEFAEYVKAAVERENYAIEHHYEAPPLPFFYPKMWPRNRDAALRAFDLQQKYDRLKVQIGMTPNDVQAVLDKPIDMRELSDGCMTMLYGEALSEEDQLRTARRPVFVLVEYRDERVVEVRWRLSPTLWD